MTDERLVEAISAVGAELRSLSREEFAKELKCRESDITLDITVQIVTG